MKRIIEVKVNFILNYLEYCLVSHFTNTDRELDEPIIGKWWGTLSPQTKRQNLKIYQHPLYLNIVLGV